MIVVVVTEVVTKAYAIRVTMALITVVVAMALLSFVKVVVGVIVGTADT